MSDFASSLQRFSSALNRISSHKIDLAQADSSIIDFKEKKKTYYLSLYNSSLKNLISFPSRDSLGTNPQNKETITTISSILDKLEQETNMDKIKELTDELLKLEKTLIYPKEEQHLTFKIKNLPSEIAEDANADIKELEQCFESGCYRASVILCGRLLETALHSVYYRATNNDLLEKSPGIGLGNLIAKIKQNNIGLDPAISQQIHLINQVRIYSVHKKQQAFCPTKEQTQAIILYTMDIIRKLFS